MATVSTQPSFHWRIIIEVGFIAAIIYLFLGNPNLTASSHDTRDEGRNSIPTSAGRAKIESLVTPRQGLQCQQHTYQIHVFSSTPLVIYVENFISSNEAEHLVSISEDKWRPSTVFNNGIEISDLAVRRSDKAMIDRDDIVQCIEQRALEIQGWPKDIYIERLWTQRYNVSGHYAHHYDWATTTKSSRRVSTFMVYLSTDGLVGGGTNFPRLQLPRDDRWCEFIECGGRSLTSTSTLPDVHGSPSADLAEDSKDEGVTFRAKAGSAVFWENFDASGRGYKETIHAGMPVRRGVKVGLNIWSWYHAGVQGSEKKKHR